MNLKQISHVYLEVAEMHLGSVLIPLVFVMRVLTAAFVVLQLTVKKWVLYTRQVSPYRSPKLCSGREKPTRLNGNS